MNYLQLSRRTDEELYSALENFGEWIFQLSYGAKQKWANQRAKPFFNLAVLIPSCSPWIGNRVLMNRRLFKHMKRRP